MDLSDHVQTVNRALPGDVATQYAWNRLLAELDRRAAEITELGNKHVAAVRELERDQVRAAAVFLRAAGGRVEVSEREMREIDGTVTREERPDGTVVFTLLGGVA